MNKLRNRFYIALLPLQALLVGLAVYAFFLLANLGVLFDQAKVRHDVMAKSIDQAVLHVHELDLAANLLLGTDSALLREEINESSVAYFAVAKKILADQFTVSKRELNEYTALNQRLEKRIQGISTTPIGDVDTTRALELEKLLTNAESQLARLSISITDQVTTIQSTFRERVAISFVVLGLGIFLGVIGTVLVSIQIGRMILEPIAILRDKVDAVAYGNLDTEIRFKRKDEIGELALAFNQMVHRLREYRQLTDQKLISTTRTFRTVLQRTPHAILFLKKDLTYFYANPQADELVGSPEFQDGLPMSLQKYAESALVKRNIMTQRQLGEAIKVVTHGQTRYFLASAFPVDLIKTEAGDDDYNKHDEGVAIILQDVTKMKLSDSLKDNVVATVSHELKTPLTSARMSLHLLGEQQIGSLNEDQIELVNTAKEDLERQLSTIQNLLDLSKIEHNLADVQHEVCKANSIAHNSVKAHLELARASRIEMHLIEAPDDPELFVDQARIEVVLNNFISNAIRHSPENSEIHIRVEAGTENVRVSVQDKGPGIDSSLKDKIFERFSQGTVTGKTGSAGLGLHIAKEVIDSYYGEIGFDSKTGQGSTFYFALPRHYGDER